MTIIPLVVPIADRIVAWANTPARVIFIQELRKYFSEISIIKIIEALDNTGRDVV